MKRLLIGLTVLVSLVPIVILAAPQVREITLPAGQSLVVKCSTTLTGTIDTKQATLNCAAVSATPTATPTPTPNPEVGRCGEAMDVWHPPVINGCATEHEHGDAPPQWVYDAGYNPSFHGDFNTSPTEHTAKHPAMKGYAARLGNVDIYFRAHMASNVLDRSARFHSYEVWARDPSGAVSHWQGWSDFGDPVADRVPWPQEDGRRPVVFVVDQAAVNINKRCEQWYTGPYNPGWTWDYGVTICDSTTLYYPGENDQQDQSYWRLTGSLGDRRRLEASWYSFRSHPTGKFYATQFGDIASGPTDPICSGTTVKYGKTYDNVCLEQYIAPTMVTVQFPNNAIDKTYATPGVKVPN